MNSVTFASIAQMIRREQRPAIRKALQTAYSELSNRRLLKGSRERKAGPKPKKKLSRNALIELTIQRLEGHSLPLKHLDTQKGIDAQVRKVYASQRAKAKTKKSNKKAKAKNSRKSYARKASAAKGRA